MDFKWSTWKAPLITLALVLIIVFAIVSTSDAQGEYNEQQYLEQTMHDMSRHMQPLLEKLGYGGQPFYQLHRVGDGVKPPFVWQIGFWPGKHKYHKTNAYLVFEAFAYFPTHTVRGDTESFKLVDEGRSVKLSYPHEAITIHQTIKDTVETTESTSESYETQFSLSVSSSISAEAKAGIEGVGEASVSTSTTTEASTSFGQSGETNNSKTVSKEFEVSVDVDEGQSVSVTVDLFKSRDVTQITESGYLDFSGYIDFGHYVPLHLNSNELHFHNRQYLIDFIEARLRLDFPQIREPLYIEDVTAFGQSIRHLLDVLQNDDIFRVDLRREEVKEYETVAEVAERCAAGRREEGRMSELDGLLHDVAGEIMDKLWSRLDPPVTAQEMFECGKAACARLGVVDVVTVPQPTEK